MKYADLHIHTLFSDGTFTPKEVVDTAKKENLSCISVVDHDTVEAIDSVEKEAALASIENIPGIEITSDENDVEYHILGYFIDHKDKSFLQLLDKIVSARVERVYLIVKKLKKHGINIEAEDIFKLAGKGTVGRLHIARVMKREGHIYSTNEAFQKYIGNNGPCYVARFKLTPKQAIAAIINTGGIPAIAHPLDLGNDDLVPQLVEWGLKGVEVYYLEYSEATINRYLAIAEKYNLLVTGGSDCHGLAKEQVRMGKIKIPYELVEKLKDAKAKM